MDERNMEQKIREALDVGPPDGMRDRVLRSARQALPTPAPARRQASVWSRAAVLGAACFVMFAAWADGGRQERMAEMNNGATAVLETPGYGWAEMRRQTEVMMAQLAAGLEADIPESGSEKERG